MDGLLCYCRPGFEPELAAELQDTAAAKGIAAFARTERGSGRVELLGADASQLGRALPFRRLIFARQKLERIAALSGLDPRDRIGPIERALETSLSQEPCADVGSSLIAKESCARESRASSLLHGRFMGRDAPFGKLLVEHSDSEADKPLAALARALANALRPVLRKSGLLAPVDRSDADWLHVDLLAGDALNLSRSRAGDRSEWDGGIPRLRMHRDAPSRSALKLEEALLSLLDEDERRRWLAPGGRAVDLGAAPGGWTWVLVRHGLRLIAIDNGPMQEQLMASNQVEHRREDGFRYLPTQSVDWMVCDMVESPRKVTERIALWLREGHCRRSIFNLKLPMKKRWQEVQLCLDQLRSSVGAELDVRAKQLYHDREEITVFAAVMR